MRTFLSSAAMLALMVAASPAGADPWKDESGHGREWKEEYHDGNCKIERKGGRGEYKEEIKCDGPRFVDRHHRHRPETVYVEPPRSGRLIIDVPLGR